MIIAMTAGRDSPAELRERLAMDEGRQRQLLRTQRKGIGELAVLCTCHRTELYATADGAEPDVVHELAALLPALQPTDQHDLRILSGAEAVEHLFRVACGLDSLVIGEPQVMGQVRRSFVLAREERAAGPVLSNIFSRALRLGRRARVETPIGRLGASIGTIAAEHLAQRFGGLDGRIGTVVGAGEAASDAAQSLRKAGARLQVVSRSLASAQRLAEEVDGEPYPLEEMPAVLARGDFAVVAVSGGVLVRTEHLPRRRFAVVDLSVPRSVEVSGRPDVELRSLEDIPGPRGPEVTTAVIDAEALVRKEVAELVRWADTRAAGTSIQQLRSQAERMVRDELVRATSGIQLTDEQAEKVATMAMRIANKLLHGPTTVLRDADDETRALISRMFGLDEL